MSGPVRITVECADLHQRLLLEEKLSAQLTDEVLPQYEFAETYQQARLPAAHLISHGTAYGGTMTASPRGEALSRIELGLFHRNMFSLPPKASPGGKLSPIGSSEPIFD